MRILSTLLCLVLLLACDPKGAGGTGGGSTTASTSTGDSNPPVVCNGPGKGEAGEPCVTDCDCCGLECATFTATDGGTTRACIEACP